MCKTYEKTFHWLGYALACEYMKDGQHHCLRCKLKQQWDSTSYLKPRKSIHRIVKGNAGKNRGEISSHTLEVGI